MSQIDSFLATNAEYVAKGKLPVVDHDAFAAKDSDKGDISRTGFAVGELGVRSVLLAED